MEVSDHQGHLTATGRTDLSDSSILLFIKNKKFSSSEFSLVYVVLTLPVLLWKQSAPLVFGNLTFPLLCFMPVWLVYPALIAATCSLLPWVYIVWPPRLSCPPFQKSSLCSMTCELSSHFSFALLPCLAWFVLFVLSFCVRFPARVILWSEYSSLTFYLRKSVVFFPPFADWVAAMCLADQLFIFSSHWTFGWLVVIGIQDAATQSPFNKSEPAKRNQDAVVCAVTSKPCSHRHQ